MSEPSTLDYLKLHWIVLIWGFTAILGELITLPAVEIVFFRVAMAAIMMAGFLVYRKVPFRMGRVATVKVALTGLIIALHWILFFAAADVANVSISLIGLATATLWASLLEPLLSKRKLLGFEVLLGLVVLGGLYIVYQVEVNYALGLLMSVLSGFCAAVFSILNSQFAKKHSQYQITFWEMTSATIGIVAFFPIYARYISEAGTLALTPSLPDWGWLLMLAGVCTVYAFSVSVELMKRISAFAVNLTINLEPVYGIVLALLIFGDNEAMNPGFYFGSAIIIAAVVSYPIVRRWKRRQTQKAQAAA